MHIAFLVGSLSSGGAQRQLLLLARALLERGHAVTLIVLFGGGAQEGEARSIEGLRFVALNSQPRMRGLSRAAGLLTAPRRLRRLVAKLEPDALYSMLHVPNAVAGLALRGRRTPALVWGVRASQLDLDWKQRAAVRFCARVSPSVPLVISNSRAGLAYLDAVGLRPRRAALVENAVDLSRFQARPEAGASLRAALGIPASASVVGTVARLDPVKRYEDLLEAFARVCAQRSDSVLLCVGGGPSAYLRALERQAQALSIGDRVVWAGHRDHAESIYSALDVFVLASRTEGFPNVLLEATACGVPCVSTDVGDARRILEGIGAVVPAGDVAALADGILQTLDAPPTGPTEARRLAERAWSPDRLAEETLAELERVVFAQARS